MKESDTRRRFAMMLKSLKIFRDSSTPFLEELSTKLTPFEFDPGQKIMSQGEYGDWLCICMKGCSSVVIKMGGKGQTRDVNVGEFRPGKYVGEMAMLGIALKR